MATFLGVDGDGSGRFMLAHGRHPAAPSFALRLAFGARSHAAPTLRWRRARSPSPPVFLPCTSIAARRTLAGAKDRTCRGYVRVAAVAPRGSSRAPSPARTTLGGTPRAGRAVTPVPLWRRLAPARTSCDADDSWTGCARTDCRRPRHHRDRAQRGAVVVVVGPRTAAQCRSLWYLAGVVRLASRLCCSSPPLLR